MSNRSNKTLRLVELALLSAVIVVLGVTPLGMIPIPVMKATTLHIPVIIGAILLGPLDGGILGFVFGLVSLMTNTFSPGVTSFVFSPFYTTGVASGNFWSLVICFVPRIMIGVTAGFLFRALAKVDRSKIIAAAATGVVGSLVNTVLVFTGISIFFGNEYAMAQGKTLFDAIKFIVLSYGIGEMVAAGFFAALITKPLFVLQAKRKL